MERLKNSAQPPSEKNIMYNKKLLQQGRNLPPVGFRLLPFILCYAPSPPHAKSKPEIPPNELLGPLKSRFFSPHALPF